MMMVYYSNLMAMTLDLMAYLKNNDDNALRYYLRSAADQYLVMVAKKLKRTLAEELKRILVLQQQIYKKKSTSVGTKNQVESFLVILDSG
jgi:hypothetical protein